MQKITCKFDYNTNEVVIKDKCREARMSVYTFLNNVDKIDNTSYSIEFAGHSIEKRDYYNDGIFVLRSTDLSKNSAKFTTFNIDRLLNFDPFTKEDRNISVRQYVPDIAQEVMGFENYISKCNLRKYSGEYYIDLFDKDKSHVYSVSVKNLINYIASMSEKEFTPISGAEEYYAELKSFHGFDKLYYCNKSKVSSNEFWINDYIYNYLKEIHVSFSRKSKYKSKVTYSNEIEARSGFNVIRFSFADFIVCYDKLYKQNFSEENKGLDTNKYEFLEHYYHEDKLFLPINEKGTTTNFYFNVDDYINAEGFRNELIKIINNKKIEFDNNQKIGKNMASTIFKDKNYINEKNKEINSIKSNQSLNDQLNLAFGQSIEHNNDYYSAEADSKYMEDKIRKIIDKKEEELKKEEEELKKARNIKLIGLQNKLDELTKKYEAAKKLNEDYIVHNMKLCGEINTLKKQAGDTVHPIIADMSLLKGENEKLKVQLDNNTKQLKEKEAHIKKLMDERKIEIDAINKIINGLSSQTQIIGNKNVELFLENRKLKDINLRSAKMLSNLNNEIDELEKKSFTNMIKNDATQAAYRVGATQMMKALKAAIVAVLQAAGKDNQTIQVIADMLDSDIGIAILSCICGYSVEKLIDDNEVAQKFAQELRVHGMSLAGNVAFETLFSTITSSIVPILNSIEKEKSNIRVEEEKREEVVEQEIENEKLYLVK